MGHDLVVIGASAGGIEALSGLLALLPADLPASLCVVVHLPAQRESYLPRILQSAGKLPVRFAVEGDKLQRSQVYLAPPDRHLLVEERHLRLRMGPKENNFRPAVDPLFRSAAVHFGTRCVGVILSGALDCGTAGMMAIKRLGGVTVVQDPADALVEEMPRNAMEGLPIDHVLPVAELGPLLVQLARTPAKRSRASSPLVAKELRIDGMAPDFDLHLPVGTPAGLTCPNCAGPLFEVPDGLLLRYRCRVGHAFGDQTLSAEQLQATESAFWAALRALEEQAALAWRMSTRARERDQDKTARSYADRAHDAEAQARIVRDELLRNLERSPELRPQRKAPKPKPAKKTRQRTPATRTALVKKRGARRPKR